MHPCGSYFDPEKLKHTVIALTFEQSEEGFWDDRQKATKSSKALAFAEDRLSEWNYLTDGVKELLSYIKISIDEKEEGSEESLKEQYAELLKRYEEFEVTLLFSNEYDSGDAIISIHAGTGGVDAQDWAEMLSRMYKRFAEIKNWKVSLIDEQKASEAGIKHATFEVKGDYVYGWLKAEAGVHRLVRISPFDAEKMRHTSFALVEILPVIPDEHAIIDETDLKIDTYRASGHGGQSVNTADSAVRITHIPTNLIVTCQNERSQLQNKMTAMKLLQGKLHHLEDLKRRKKISDIKGDHQKAQWGNQARSYVLQPYKQVKDHRSNKVIVDVESVLDGELEELIISYLKMKDSSDAPI